MVRSMFLLKLTLAGAYGECQKRRKACLRGNSGLRELPQRELDCGVKHLTKLPRKKLPCGEWKWVTTPRRGVISMCRFWGNLLESHFLSPYPSPVFPAYSSRQQPLLNLCSRSFSKKLGLS